MSRSDKNIVNRITRNQKTREGSIIPTRKPRMIDRIGTQLRGGSRRRVNMQLADARFNVGIDEPHDLKPAPIDVFSKHM